MNINKDHMPINNKLNFNVPNRRTRQSNTLYVPSQRTN